MALFEEYKNNLTKLSGKGLIIGQLQSDFNVLMDLMYQTSLFKLLVKILKEKSQWMKPKY